MGANQYTKIEECILTFCCDPHKAMGYCNKHYRRYLRHDGNPLGGRAPVGEPQAFIEYAIRLNTQDCIDWPYGKDRDGYGKIKIAGKQIYAHRYALTLVCGEPLDEECNHALHNPILCNNRGCINALNHLRWGSHEDNMEDRRIRILHEKSISMENIP